MKPSTLTLLLLSSAITQTGCISAVVTPATQNFAAGILLLNTGTEMIEDCNWGTPSASRCAALSALLTLGGIALDGENPGRNEALNWLPVDGASAKRLATDEAALELYNQELALVMDANARIESDLQPIAQGDRSAEALDALARTLGLQDANELVRVMSGEKLSASDLQKFSDQNGLTRETARIYLSLRFGIKT